jgi:predicted peptidase
MIRRIIGAVVVGALFVAACAEAQEVPTRTHLQGEYQADDGSTMRYLVWLPDGYGENRDKQHPLIVFLHGSGDPEFDSEFVLSFGLPAVLELGEEPEGFDFVVVSPQASPNTAFWQGRQIDVIDDLLQDVLDTYLVDPDRVYLTGLSMGGYSSWYLATAYPERYAAMASLSGSGYQNMDQLPASFICRMVPVPVWGIHGEKDLIADYQVVESLVLRYQDICDTSVEWTSYPEAGHLETYERAYRDPELYNWMLSHTLSGR